MDKDNRFSHIYKDPRFKSIPKSEKKVKIDKRFQSIFSDKKFHVKYTVDKRGRPINQSSTENFRKYYHLSSDEDSEEDTNDENLQKKESTRELGQNNIRSISEEEVDNVSSDDDSKEETEDTERKELRNCLNKTHEKVWTVTDSAEKTSLNDVHTLETDTNKDKSYTKLKKSKKGIEAIDDDLIKEDDIQRLRMTDEVKKKLRDTQVDYARGMGTLMTDSSSDEETSDEESDQSEIEHAWGELDQDAEEIEEATHRLAILHMDWDRIRAADLMVLCNSFLPSGGLIKSVSIYPSEFGLQRLKEEEEKGPIELVESAKKGSLNEDEEDENNKEGSKYHMEKLRQYQLTRLKYYYAVVEFDSVETANKVYTECDGMEYESSSTKLDLRFIPDDVTFDHEPKEVVTSMPDPSKYKPRHFTNTALQQGKVELTWDETNPERKEFTKKVLTNVDNVTDEDLQAYLAYSSGEDEDEEDKEKAKVKIENNLNDVDNSSKESEEENDDDKIAKYRTLLANIEDLEEKKKEQDVELEISWGVGLKEKTQKLVEEKLKTPLTPFEAMLEKKRQKKKMKKQEKLKKEKGNSEGDSDNLYSDDDIPSDVDMNDPYFREELENMPKPKKNIKKSTKEEETEEDKQRKAELELLMLEEESEEINKSHFSLKSIQDQENDNKKKKRRKQLKKKKVKEMPIDVEDNFQVDVADERFSAIYSSHHYNIDPADPQFRKTKAMEAIISEKLNRRKREDDMSALEQPSKKSLKLNPELTTLVKSVKKKVQKNIS
uniref:Uncharacterized protein n=1 Tax=Clastoptera arizonana TaxID=38151 RepID=A0A1B6D9T8_9HEMI